MLSLYNKACSACAVTLMAWIVHCNKLTSGEVLWNRVHLVLQHFSMKSRDVEWLHSVRQAASQHCIHVHTTAN